MVVCAGSQALASQDRKLELPVPNSQAGAGELEKIAGSLDAMESNRGISKSANLRLRFTSSRLPALIFLAHKSHHVLIAWRAA